MQIIALKEYTDKYISLYEGEIRNVSSTIASKLIEQGIVAEHDQISPSGGGGGDSSSSSDSGVFLIKGQDNSGNIQLDKTTTQIIEAFFQGKICTILLEGLTAEIFCNMQSQATIGFQYITQINKAANGFTYITSNINRSYEGFLNDYPLYLAGD